MVDLGKHLENAADAVKRRNYALAIKIYTQVLQIQPDYGEALFYKGSILLKGLDRPAQAIVFLQRYLDGNPTGSYGDTARQEIADAKAELAGGSGSGSGSGATPSAGPSSPPAGTEPPGPTG